MNKPVNTTFIHVMTVVHRALYRWTGGVIGANAAGLPNLLLTTTGRKSGQPRTVPLVYVEDGDRCVVIASYGGSPTHPAWWLNLEADPNATVQIRGRTFPVTARKATGDERAELWPRAVKLYGGYAGYQRITDREIPVVILEPAD